MGIYLDYGATAPMPQDVREAFVEALTTVGNPASQHAHGQHARSVLESARERIAGELGVTRDEVVFTSGGTEAVNLALKGLFWQRNKDRERPVMLVAAGEHHATLDTVQWLEDQGAECVSIPLDQYGMLNLTALQAVLESIETDRISFMTLLWVNNEVGTIQPVAEVTKLCAMYDVPVHVDAVAALGLVDVAELELRPAAMSFSAHKIGGPVSAGALVLARGAEITPLIHGGSQQRARSGTQDAAGAVAFATALERARPTEAKLSRLRALRDRLIVGIRELDPTAVLRGADPAVHGEDARSAANVHFTFPGAQGDSLVFLLDQAGISVSTGSACTAGVTEVSHVMQALGLADEIGIGALRFTLGAETTAEEIDEVLDRLPGVLESARRAGLISL